MLWEKNNQKEMTITRGQQLFQTQNTNDQPKRQLFFKMQNKKVGNYIFFNKKLPLEDIKFRFQRCKIKCNAIVFNQFERFLIVIKYFIYLNLILVYVCSIMLFECTMKSEQ